MKSNHVQYQVTGPPGYAASAKLVPDAAAWEIRTSAFGYGVLLGAVFGGVLMLFVLYNASKSDKPDEGTIVLDESSDSTSSPETGRARQVDSQHAAPAKSSGIPSLGPNIPGEYAYAIDEDEYLQVKRGLDPNRDTGTVIDGQFMVTAVRPAEALDLPQSIDDSWNSPYVFSGKLKKPVVLQRKDASWWSEKRGAYIPWGWEHEQPDKLIYDAKHDIAVPTIMLTKSEVAVVNGAPLKIFDDRLCLHSMSMQGFVPLRCPTDQRITWNEAEAAYVGSRGEKVAADQIYNATTNANQTQESQL